MRNSLIVLSLIVLLAACGANDKPAAESNQPKTEQIASAVDTGLNSILTAYFALKDDLVESNSANAQNAAKTLTAKIDAMSDKAAGMVESMATAKELAGKIAAESDLAKQREMFLPLSETMINVAKTAGSSGNALYVQHCPMAFNNTGGDWLSNSKEIMNPYFGDRMLHCGAVTETLAGN